MRWFPGETFADEAEALRARLGEPLLEAERGRFVFSGAGERLALHPPAIAPPCSAGSSLSGYLARYPADELDLEEGRIALLLVQADRAALALLEDGDFVDHKALRRYTVRGTGRAQETHLKTRGKSRYGSRLRLQNAKLLREEINERLHRWWDEDGDFRVLLRSVPKRTWPTLWEVDPAPPFAEDAPFVDIPTDVRPPNFEELERVWRICRRGRVVPLA